MFQSDQLQTAVAWGLVLAMCVIVYGTSANEPATLATINRLSAQTIPEPSAAALAVAPAALRRSRRR